MACPYFYPVKAQGGSAMLPLGGWWTGECRAEPGAPRANDGSGSETACNLGYGRGGCGRFPAGEGPDAVRFTISGCDGEAIRMTYVMERDHGPYAHGQLEYSRAAKGLTAPGETATLERQAEAYAESYLRRKEEA